MSVAFWFRRDSPAGTGSEYWFVGLRPANLVYAALDSGVTPLAFSTTAVTEIRDVLHTSRCPLIDFFDLHMSRVESILGR